MNPHFFTATFYFAFIWFRALVAASPQLYVGRCPVKNHSRPFLWKGQMHLSTKIGHETKKIRHKN